MEREKNETTINQQPGATADQSGRGLYDRAVETAGKVYGVVSEKASDKIDAQTTSLSEGLTEIADGIRNTGTQMNEGSSENVIAAAAADYSSTAANAINDVADYFRRKDPRDMLHDAEDLARRNPAVFFAAAFGLGILAARFLKSSPRTLNAAAGASFGSTQAHRSGGTPAYRGN